MLLDLGLRDNINFSSNPQKLTNCMKVQLVKPLMLSTVKVWYELNHENQPMRGPLISSEVDVVLSGTNPE